MSTPASPVPLGPCEAGDRRALETELFRTLTAAEPEVVWASLTATGERIAHLFGLAVDTTWQAGDPITVGVPHGPRLTGRVLRVDPHRRLSYTLGDTDHEPAVYVTWELVPLDNGTIVRLYVDESEPSGTVEIERSWLPVLASLDRHLQATTEDEP